MLCQQKKTTKGKRRVVLEVGAQPVSWYRETSQHLGHLLTGNWGGPNIEALKQKIYRKSCAKLSDEKFNKTVL